MKFNFLQKLKEKMYNFFSENGFTCDACGAEIFQYPEKRLCKNCESAMRENDGRRCPKCGRKTLAEGVCLSCKSRAPRFTHGLSPYVYRGETASFVNRFKNGNAPLIHYFAENMAECFVREYEGISRFQDGESLLVISVPLTKERAQERGYNQAELLAKGFCKRLQKLGYLVELDLDVLQKTRETAQQKHMGFTSRAENVAGVYHVHKRKACRGKTILLVDDIMTTGATGSACADRLLHAGAKEVLFVVAASLPEMK